MIRFNKSGFTLLEIVVLISIIGILFTLFIPNIKIIQDLKLNLKVRTLKKDIIKYRNKALIEKKVYSILMDKNKNQYYFVENVEGKNINSKKVYLGDDLKFTENAYLSLSSSGNIVNPGTILLRSKDKYFKISLTPVTGQINLKHEIRRYE